MKNRRTALILGLIIFLSALVCGFSYTVSAQSASRPSECGFLHLDGTKLSCESGKAVRLCGISTHGLTYYPEFVNKELFSQLSREWNCNLIRLAMYSSEYCKSDANAEKSRDILEKGVEYAVAADMYVICDWHILEEKNPNVNIDEAAEFFGEISAKYANIPNVIYEICNEPNGDTTWQDIKSYAEKIIPIIKANSPDAVIIVGTPDYCSDLASPEKDRISDYTNIMYSFHFYAAGHGDDYRTELENAVSNGLPVFVSECGIVGADGSGKIDFDSAEEWFTLLEKYGIGFTVWNLSSKRETSSIVLGNGKNKSYSSLSDKDLSACGQYVKALLSGTEISEIRSCVSGATELYGLFRCDMRYSYGAIALCAVLLLLVFFGISLLAKGRKNISYGMLLKKTGDTAEGKSDKKSRRIYGKLALVFSVYTTIVYLTWRIIFSMPDAYGRFPSVCSVILLVVEIVGFIESCIHYSGMVRLRRYSLPKIAAEEYPDVDVFVATYNEPAEVLRKTLIGCRRMDYPDKSKVHIYLCDDNRRPEMEALADEIGVNYFKRADNKGAKAGNLNAALARTSSPYIITFDADMIPRREFLLKTIPYFVDAEKRNESLPEKERMPLGLLQTPQSFYNADVFQHNLYAENRIPNEQDFFYRTIEPAKTNSNSVIYGGSNTVLSRRALEDIGGFYTDSITEDFATGMLIEENGYISLGLSEPLASGLAPSSFKEHIQQRTRWGRGVILTAKKMHIITSRKLTFRQKLSYLSAVFFWYSSVKNWIYILSPLMFAVLGVPILVCSLRDILVFWLPMFVFQNLTLRLISGGSVSAKRSGIHETSVMPFLFFPVIKETLGISLSTFKVTEKKASLGKRQRSFRMLLPFLVLILLSAFGIARVTYLFVTTRSISLCSVMYWLIRNLYFLIMCLFLVDGRDGNGENVVVCDAEPVTVMYKGNTYEGITTAMTEHGISVFADGDFRMKLGESVSVSLDGFELSGAVVALRESQNENVPPNYTVEILDFGGHRDDYIYLLYNRIPTMPQNLNRDIGFFRDLWNNLVRHIAAGTKY